MSVYQHNPIFFIEFTLGIKDIMVHTVFFLEC
jgi:hypothetical protein